MQEWPQNGLEAVPVCPVCGAVRRKIMYQGVADRIFCAPGQWNIYSCQACGSGYLDPRPNRETIGKAYQGYFTHNERIRFTDLSLPGKVQCWLANGYRNYRFGTCEKPATFLGILTAMIMPSMRSIVDAGMRHLPRPMAGNRLLDVGCGNGKFLVRAASAGWDVVGVDFDKHAVAAACSLGLDVRLGGIECLNPDVERFDVITLAHVIEHVHDPVAVLKSCFALLKRGGSVWIETPNITSQGHRLFGQYWRGLEPPRHLVLFTRSALCAALKTAGFVESEDPPYRPMCRTIFQLSKAIADGINPYSASEGVISSAVVKEAERRAEIDPDCREFITLKAWKK